MYRAAASFAALLLALLPQAALGIVGEITHLAGTVVAHRPDGQTRILQVRSQVNEGDLLVTVTNTYARLKFTDGAEVVLRPDSQLRINNYVFSETDAAKDNAVISLLKGGFRSITGLLARRNPARAQYTTPTATIGIRGTHFGALYCSNDCANVPSPRGGPPPNGLHVDVADGRIVVTSQAGSREFSVGQFGYVASPTVLPVPVPAGQGIRATLPAQALVVSIRGGTVGRAGDLECVIR